MPRNGFLLKLVGENRPFLGALGKGRRIMTDKSPRKLAEVLATGRLAALGREAEQRRTTTERIRALLPPDEAEHLVSATTRDGELVLVMDSAVWAARVRYRGAELGAERLRVKVVPAG